MEKRIAQVISVIFYPLFVPTYAFAILLTMPAYFSALMPVNAKWMVIGLIFLTTCILPTLFIIAMIKSGIVSTTYLSKREDRTMPYIVSIIFFYVTYYLLKKLQISPVYYYFMIGATLLNILVMGINFFWKISSHMASIGALAGMMLGLSYFLGTFYFSLIALTLLMAGITGFARLKLQAHTPAQIYSGFLLGFFTILALFLYKI
jgi:membrane-associated phospholipid phosphatase